MEETLDVVALQAQEKGIELLLFFDRDLPYSLMGDSARLRQILINLLGNAVKFTTHGEVSLSVKTVSSQNGSMNIRFEVTDTGPGISSRIRARLFTPFVQADPSVTRNFGGTGLGLAISGKLVDMMGGSIGFDSTEGAGSTFWFTVSFETPSVGSEPFPQTKCDCSGRRFLIADASASSRRMIRTLIEEWGGTVQETESEDGLLKILKESGKDACAFDAVIMAASITDSD